MAEKHPYAQFAMRRALLAGVVAAFLAHAGVVVCGFAKPSVPAPSRASRPAMTMELATVVAPEPPPPAPKRARRPARAAIPAPAPVPPDSQEVREAEPAAEALAAEVAVAAPVAAEPPPARPAVSAKSVARAYLTALSREFEKRKEYPATARRLKQEGAVRVRFTVAEDGTIGEVAIAKASPYSSLNESALRAVMSLGKFEPIPAALGRKTWKMEIPVRYRLDR